MPSQSSLWLKLVIMMWLIPINVHGMERTALVIGNGSYAYDPLANPPNDARDMAKALGELGFEVMLRLNVDHKAFEDAVREFRRLVQRRGGVAMFYYAGHGVQVQGQNYLVPVDT